MKIYKFFSESKEYANTLLKIYFNHIPGTILACSWSQNVQLKKVQWKFLLCADSFDKIQVPIKPRTVFCSSDFLIELLMTLQVHLGRTNCYICAVEKKYYNNACHIPTYALVSILALFQSALAMNQKILFYTDVWAD